MEKTICNVEGCLFNGSYCRIHRSEKPKKLYNIPKVSDKRKSDAKEYKKLNIAYLKAHPFCEALLDGCTKIATQVHHLFSGKNRAKYYLDMKTYKAICQSCHTAVHSKLSKEEAVRLGLKLIESGEDLRK